MKLLMLVMDSLAVCFCSVAQEKAASTLDEYSRLKGPPIVVAPAYRFTDGKLPTVSFYELDQSPFSALTLKRDRYLVYTSDKEFAHKVAWHFKSMSDLKAWTGSTMYAAPWTPLFGASAPTAQLEIVHFDASGRLVDVRQIRVHIAYFEAGAEGREIRKPTAR